MCAADRTFDTKRGVTAEMLKGGSRALSVRCRTFRRASAQLAAASTAESYKQLTVRVSARQCSCVCLLRYYRTVAL